MFVRCFLMVLMCALPIRSHAQVRQAVLIRTSGGSLENEDLALVLGLEFNSIDSSASIIPSHIPFQAAYEACQKAVVAILSGDGENLLAQYEPFVVDGNDVTDRMLSDLILFSERFPNVKPSRLEVARIDKLGELYYAEVHSGVYLEKGFSERLFHWDFPFVIQKEGTLQLKAYRPERSTLYVPPIITLIFAQRHFERTNKSRLDISPDVFQHHVSIQGNFEGLSVPVDYKMHFNGYCIDEDGRTFIEGDMPPAIQFYSDMITALSNIDISNPRVDLDYEYFVSGVLGGPSKAFEQRIDADTENELMRIGEAVGSNRVQYMIDMEGVFALYSTNNEGNYSVALILSEADSPFRMIRDDALFDITSSARGYNGLWEIVTQPNLIDYIEKQVSECKR